MKFLFTDSKITSVDFEKCWDGNILFVKIGVDTFENGPPTGFGQTLQSSRYNYRYWSIASDSYPPGRLQRWRNFGKMLLVFGCIGTEVCKRIRVLQHFSKSTRLSSWHFLKFGKFCKFCGICKILLNFHKSCWLFKPIFCEKFEIAAVQKDANLVELEKCCQTHIFLQNFVLIQPRTSPPKIAKLTKSLNVSNSAN